MNVPRTVALALLLGLGLLAAPAATDTIELTENASAGRVCVQYRCASNPVPLDCFVKVAAANCGFA